MAIDKKNLFPADGGIGRAGVSTRSEQWVEDAVFVEQGSPRQPRLPSSGEFHGTSVARRRMRVFFMCIAVLFTLITGRVFYLQVWRGSHYAVAAERNRQRVLPIPAERGLIFDRNGVQLTENIPRFSLALVPQDLPRDRLVREQVVRKLAQLIDKDTRDIRQTLEDYGAYSYESIIIQEDLDYETALSIHIAAAELPGIHIQRGSKRLYTHTLPTASSTVVSSADSSTSSSIRSLSHVFGYLAKLSPEELDRLYDSGYLPSDSIGKSGIEQSYESTLRGTYGEQRIEVDARGREQTVLAESAPTPGNHLRLAIDAGMQAALERALRTGMSELDTARGAAIVLDVNSGAVRALVSLPTFNNNDFSGGIDSATYRAYIENSDRPLFQRAIAGTYPSGSTIKPFIAMAALQEGVITKNTTVRSTGGLNVGPWFFPDWRPGGHGITDVRKSIADSVNTFYYYIGGGYNDFVGLGVDRITEYLSTFGFAQELGIDIPGETRGFLPSREWKQEQKGERWYVGDTYNLSIGQGDLLVTPLQIAATTAAIANGGTVYAPRIVDAILDPVTEQEQHVNPEVTRELPIDARHIQTVRQGMRDCVTDWACRRLSLLSFSSAGKTGTAQWNSTKENHAWFTSFAPYEKPEIVVTVLVEEGGGGSAVAAPIAYEFYQWWGENRLMP